MNIFKKITKILSAISIAYSAFSFAMFAFPGIVSFEESVGFPIILVCIILSCTTMVLLPLYCFMQKDNSKLKTLGLITVLTESLLLITTFFNILPFGDSVLTLNIVAPMIFNILFISFI